MRHLDRVKSENRGVVQGKEGDSRLGLYDFEMYRRRVEVSFSQVRRKRGVKNFVEFSFWVEERAKGRLGITIFRSRNTSHVTFHFKVLTSIQPYVSI